ncbi:hypothetical protein GM160_00530 [Guyparkeria halophila]|uniref:DUF5666 domain-containing protein n=1 Tax=Guyparkeria halophila TaxID=47960 RepID=A0A6I6CSS3_9GAMM|nr:hypothetical protein [Guyparkeria halophila]QGT77486.1 hypothetical protein GM160_00530 [Guyparkeria halophila]
MIQFVKTRREILSRGVMLLIVASLPFGGFIAASAQERAPSTDLSTPDRLIISGKLTSVSGTFIQIGGELYDLSEPVSVKGPAGEPISLSDLEPGMDVRCEANTTPAGEPVIETIRIFVQ